LTTKYISIYQKTN